MAQRLLNLRTGQPLALSAIQQHCPAVFATEPHPTRGPKYEYIPTIQPLEKLLEQGWAVYEASQNRVRDMTREGFTRHSLRLRPTGIAVKKNKYGGPADGTPELILSNAHDGTAAYTLTAGYFRLVCSNGMCTGKSIASARIIHSKGRSTSEVIDVASRIIEDDFPRMIAQIEGFQLATFSEEQGYELAKTAMELRYGNTLHPFPLTDLLRVRRPVDDGLTAWSVLNRIQENVMQGGWETRSVFSGRKSSVRSVEAITATHKINTGLWTRCEELCNA